jgi:Zn-dependent protease with chaperone function
MVDRLRQRAGLPMPVVAIAPHEQPNAFATGRNPENSVVCVTEGLLRLMSREELEGVIAHELAHIKNRDMLLQTIAATMAGAIGNIAQFAMFFGGGRDDEDHANPLLAILIMIIGPIIAMVIQFAISRQREFKADAVGAEISGKPLALASALGRLEMGASRIPMQVVQHAPAHRRAHRGATADRRSVLSARREEMRPRGQTQGYAVPSAPEDVPSRWNTNSSTTWPPLRCSTTMRSISSGVTPWYHTPSG